MIFSYIMFIEVSGDLVSLKDRIKTRLNCLNTCVNGCLWMGVDSGLLLNFLHMEFNSSFNIFTSAAKQSRVIWVFLREVLTNNVQLFIQPWWPTSCQTTPPYRILIAFKNRIFAKYIFFIKTIRYLSCLYVNSCNSCHGYAVLYFASQT